MAAVALVALGMSPISLAKDPLSVDVPLVAATRDALSRHTVEATAHDQAVHCEGVELAALLRKVGAMPADPLRGKQLPHYVRVEARDGYRAVFSLAELDATLGNAKVFLVDRCDGKALDDKSGPLRLIAPGEARPARWVRQVQSIRVVDAP